MNHFQGGFYIGLIKNTNSYSALRFGIINAKKTLAINKRKSPSGRQAAFFCQKVPILTFDSYSVQQN